MSSTTRPIARICGPNDITTAKSVINAEDAGRRSRPSRADDRARRARSRSGRAAPADATIERARQARDPDERQPDRQAEQQRDRERAFVIDSRGRRPRGEPAAMRCRAVPRRPRQRRRARRGTTIVNARETAPFGLRPRLHDRSPETQVRDRPSGSRRRRRRTVCVSPSDRGLKSELPQLEVRQQERQRDHAPPTIATRPRAQPTCARFVHRPRTVSSQRDVDRDDGPKKSR